MTSLPEIGKGPQGHNFDRLPLERLPAGMRERKQWAVAGANKAPLATDANGELGLISVNEPIEWLTFDEAVAICERNTELVTYAAAKDGSIFTQTGLNVGFIFHKEDEFACIDLDIKDAETHPDKPELWTTDKQRERHADIVEAFDSYTEWSRSGKGLHILLKGKLPNEGEGKKRDHVETYSQQRFLICTGNVSRDKPAEWRQELLTGLATELMPHTQSDLPALESQPEKESDEAVIGRAWNASNAEKFRNLWEGKWGGSYPSQSEADMALIEILAFYSPNNEQCSRIFRRSSLGQRDKATQNNVYLNRTIVKVRAGQAQKQAQEQAHKQALMDQVDFSGILEKMGAGQPTQAMQPAAQQPLAQPVVADTSWHAPPKIRISFDRDLDREPPPSWLVKGIIPSTGIGAIYGASGTFKSFLALDLLAHIANSREWFGNRVRGVHAVYVPFEGRGGIPKRVQAWRLAQEREREPNVFHIASAENTHSNIGFIMDPINLMSDCDELIKVLQAANYKDGILCIDTLAQAANGLDENSSEMGRIISRFQYLQQKLGGVVLIIHHSGKDEGKGMRGWSGLHAAMDFVIECKRDDKRKDTASFKIGKAKDGPDGAFFKFAAEPISLGMDDDGDSISSLVIKPINDKDEADEASADEDHSATDEFVLERVKAELAETRFPTQRSLENQLSTWTKTITQKAYRESITRLKACGKLRISTEKAPNGRTYLILGE
jgi:hypothetical protein